MLDELETLEDLHMFRATKISADLFEYVYASQLQVSIPCKSFVPIVRHVNVMRLDKARAKFKDDFPRLSDFFLDMAKRHIEHRLDPTVRHVGPSCYEQDVLNSILIGPYQIVQRLNDYWASCAQLKSQLKLLLVKYPVEIEISGSLYEESCFRAKVTVLFPAVKAKAFISFVFSTETFCHWPMNINLLQCHVDVVYGPVQ
jgi:kinetochore protein Spc7/SPC105